MDSSVILSSGSGRGARGGQRAQLGQVDGAGRVRGQRFARAVPGDGDGGDDDAIAATIAGAVAGKWAGHRIGNVDFVRPGRSMSQIGG